MGFRTVVITLFLISPCVTHAQLNPLQAQIPMRDGQTLAADVYLPSDQSTYPVILIQTPYNKNLYHLSLPLNIGLDIASSPYAVVILDWRCFYGSTNACNSNVAHGQDGYDAVEWIAAQDWCNGKVGTWGPSALGDVQFLTAREHPPHLVCAVPVVASPQTRYGQFYPGGVALPEYLQTLNMLFGDAFVLVAQNPYYNLVWQFTENSTFYPSEIEIPMLHIGGWFDHNTEDVLTWFQAIRMQSPAAGAQWLLMGPWTHSGTGAVTQGDLDFPEAANTNNVYARAFFDHYLRDIDNGWEATTPVTYFQMGDSKWLASTTFPPDGETEDEQYYLRQDMSLSPMLSGSAQTMSFDYDPEDPSPTVGGKTLSQDLDQGPYDQAPLVESRNDNLIFTTPVLTDDLPVKGRIRVKLYVSSDRFDTDIALRLTEVYPDGRSIALGQIVQRMRFRTGYTMNDETLMQPDDVYEINVEFDDLANTFKAGHRIRLIITSSNYPWFNRNMNNGMEMYPNNNLDTVVNPLVAHNHIHLQGIYPSEVVFPVSMGSNAIHETGTSAIALYPNPAQDRVTITHCAAGSEISLWDMNGRMVKRITATSDPLQLNVATYPTGIYMVDISSAKGHLLKKVCILGH